ncbi:hypothetical protein ACGFMM_01345 [Streptomyces sp. NPDC048604]|uniref:hypothetical protein n=1 Tax=Streptomyces sp. NPDC048604 TaxID=3365578 RepID=UPI00371EB17A
MTTVRMRHPDLPDAQEIHVDTAAVPIHRSAGWVAVEDAPAPSPVLPAPADDTSDLPARKRRRAVSEESD